LDKAASEGPKAVSSAGTDGEAVSSAAAPVSTKRQLRKIIREDSNWSPRGLIIAALTGVSVAAISTQLTGLLGSTVLIAVMAMVSATVSELYRIFLALTGLGAKKAAEKAAILRSRELSGGEAPGPYPEAASELDPITEAMATITSAYKMPENVPRKKSVFGRFFQRLASYGRANPFFWAVLVFVGIAGSTIAVVYSISDGQPTQIINRTVTVEESMSPSEKQAIVDQTEEQLMEELQKRIDSAISSETTSQASDLSELEARLSELSQKVETLEASTIPPTTPPATNDDSTQELAELREQLEALQASYDELKARLDAIEAEPAIESTTSPTANSTAQAPS